MTTFLDRLIGRDRKTLRGMSKLRLSDVKLPDVRMPQIPPMHMPEFQSFETWDQQGRGDRAGALLIPAVLSLAGAGVAFIWWRQWAQGGAEAEIAGAPEPDTARPTQPEAVEPEAEL